MDPGGRDWSDEIARSQIFTIPFPQGSRRLQVDLSHKLARDELCQQWGRSPLRQQQWGSVVVRARLTAAQESNGCRVLAAL